MDNLMKSGPFFMDYTLPKKGMTRENINKHIEEMCAKDPTPRSASMSFYTMKGSKEVQDVLLDAYGKTFHKNNLVAIMLPGMQQMEDELLSMAANLLSGESEGVVTNITSGGTESIFCAVHAAREWARETKPQVTKPNFVVPYSAHATLGKAGHYLGVDIVRVPVGKDFRADINAIKSAIGPQTIGLYASAPNWPYGTYDMVEEFGQVALENDLWLHVDACVGGFMAPFATMLGYHIPKWDFSVPGVTSISADLHKYGYAMKPASIIAWRDQSLLKYHKVVISDWPTVPYSSQGFVGSRSAGPVSAAWAVMHFLGEEGYKEYTRITMENKERLTNAIRQIDGLVTVENELCILCYMSDDKALTVEGIVGGMEELGWLHFGTLDPPMVQLVLDPVPAQYIDDYIHDLKKVVQQIKKGESNVQGTLKYTS